VVKISLLISIVGTNPLPNYVVGKYLKEKKSVKKSIFVYSEKTQFQDGTKRYAVRLCCLLGFNKNFFIHLSDIGNPKRIYADLEEIQEYINSYEEIYLNYTGGTKTMAVHTYNFFKEKKINFKGLYLDARSFKICYDDGEIAPENGDLRKYKIDIETLLSLHLYKIENLQKLSQNYKTGRYIDKIKKEIIKKERINQFLEWIEDPFRKIFKKNGKIIEKINEFKKNLKSFGGEAAKKKFENETPDFIWAILNSFPENEKIIDKNKKLWVPFNNMTNREFKEKIKSTIEMLDGKWLEWYVYTELIEKFTENELKKGKQIGISLIAFKEDKIRRTFELDLFLMHGYQIIGISVTTDKKSSICKSKGFEVLHRIKQIGGDESRAFLITTMDQNLTSSLQEDLSIITGTAEEKIIVYGLRDLQEISELIINEVYG